jgi:uncharacterized membrane-anchored protein
MPESNAIQTAPARGSLADRLVAALKGREKTVLLAGLGLQLAILLGMTALRAYALTRGDVYYVRVQPVDPRDFFRGDYVILGYSFSRLPSEFSGNPHIKNGGTIYVELVPEGDGRHWGAGRFSLTPPGHGPYLRGTIIGSSRVDYGIESFYVQEGQGRRYEQAVRSGRLSAEIAVSPDDTAVLRGLHIEP